MRMQIKVQEPALFPVRAHPTDAGLDMFCTITTWVPSKSSLMVDTGVAVKIPEGFMGMVVSRSGQGKIDVALANSVGIIDSDYRGNIKVILSNRGNTDYHITRAITRIAQLIIVPIVIPTLVEVDDENWNDTARGTNGFGSSDGV